MGSSELGAPREMMQNVKELLPENIRDYVRGVQRNYRRRAFHGDVVYQELVGGLIRSLDISLFVETGTNMGDSSRYVASLNTEIRVATCDINPEFVAKARRRLWRVHNVECSCISSEFFLKGIVSDLQGQIVPMFFLDAHWETYWPLPDELQVISSNCQRAVIIVDDFEIPGRREFGFDSYSVPDMSGKQEPVTCGMALLRRNLSRDNSYDLLIPRYSGTDAFPKRHGVLRGYVHGPLRGHVAVFQNLSTQFQALLGTSDLIKDAYEPYTDL
jgi:predicted O-methyltransferase YrrM